MNIGSDHRLVGGTAKTNTRIQRSRMMRAGKSKVNIEMLLLKKEEFQLQLQNRLEVLREEGEEDVEEMVSMITNAIQESALDIAGRHREQTYKKLKSKTTNLSKSREMIERGIPRTNIEYVEICKTIRKLVRDGIRENNSIRVKEEVEAGKGLKKATTKEECEAMSPLLKEEDGSITTNRE